MEDRLLLYMLAIITQTGNPIASQKGMSLAVYLLSHGKATHHNRMLSILFRRLTNALSNGFGCFTDTVALPSVVT